VSFLAFSPSSELVAAPGGVTPPDSTRASLFSPQPGSPSKIAAVVPSNATLRIIDFMMFQALLRVDGASRERKKHPTGIRK